MMHAIHGMFIGGLLLMLPLIVGLVSWAAARIVEYVQECASDGRYEELLFRTFLVGLVMVGLSGIMYVCYKQAIGTDWTGQAEPVQETAVSK